MDPLDLAGRCVVVTGGTRGIGAAIATAFLAAGARVLVCGRHEPTELPRSGEGTAEFVRADVRDSEQAAALIAAAVKRFGGVDVLVNNAGGAPPAPADSASPRLHAKILELNLLAPLHVSQAACPVMREQSGGGLILMVGSVSGARPSPGAAAYGAAKAGLHHLATSLAMEWAPKVRVNTLVVGPVDTAAGPLVDPEAVARTVPLGRAATPAEVAGACLLLASPLAGYVSGSALAVHGGGEWPGYLADPRAAAYPPQK
ncbi:SDR family oxidoreductase [Couchioplanes caeruleus]|uniref:Short chain dehydrogenase n=2 Tax=Couchioplanes caeruleus TaxID=56438 RepID=A0A1K0FQV0_9ACTN|nr:SDR family oxidoreductase [Couchioplanes caeruleus]OJF15197.1 short chain dehydrogenase [Couchioplanes caeruleus subsp. caeruleus]ROP28022.1 NAD(P)-dependent dehydrogenase (short-subunit alcohol dehydrogenase family) [Couchioplanes caeruleus]